MLKKLLEHHVLANLTFVLVLTIGLLSFLQMPREKDPTINFNWIQITTIYPGASAIDVEERITEPLEEGVARVSDIDFIASTSRESSSSILVRFEDISPDLFDKRINDLRREVQQIENTRFPEEVDSPLIYELTSSNAFPTATLVLQGESWNDNLRFSAQVLEKELERSNDIFRVDLIGDSDPELIVEVDKQKLIGLGISATQVADTLRERYKNTSAGVIFVAEQQWLLRVTGSSHNAQYLANTPIYGITEKILIGDIADVYWGQERLTQKAKFNGKPAILLSVYKKDKVNTLEMVAKIKQYIAKKNLTQDKTGLNLVLVDDQTLSTRSALAIMQNNALIGFILVLLVTWLFLGTRIAFFTSIGIPFTLAGTFWILNSIGYTLNNSVLLGVVIALGMLVDDAVVVVESIYNRLRQGIDATTAAIISLKEVVAPVTTSVLTTMAAFLPLMLMPGIVGKFMLVVPLVVTIALALSLLEAYWMLPAHIIAAKVTFTPDNKIQRWRVWLMHHVQIKYCRLLIKSLRYPLRMLIFSILLFIGAVSVVANGLIKIDFFAGDSFRIFYVSLDMPAGTSIDQTMGKLDQLDKLIKSSLKKQEYRSIVPYAGMKFTEMEPLFGEHLGQILVSVNDHSDGMRTMQEMQNTLKQQFPLIVGASSISILQLKDGPPTTRAISLKVLGSEFPTIRNAIDDIKHFLQTLDDVENISVLDSAGSKQMTFAFNNDALHRSGLSANDVSRQIKMMVEGEIVSSFQYRGEKIVVRVKDKTFSSGDISDLLLQPISLPQQENTKNLTIPLAELVNISYTKGKSSIHHYNLSRSISIEADIVEGGRNTLVINKLIEQYWLQAQYKHPGIKLDFSGELDDINESLDALPMLFIMGLGLMYLILGTQFKSYWQPMIIILATIPLAFTGVIAGLYVSNNPISLYTLYGMVALVGISVNAAIVLISAANDRLNSGMSINHSTVYAARRRVIPIIITTLTTIAGLFSLAAGFAGDSLIWGPIATAIVWGLGFSSVLTLFVIPLLFRFFMTWRGEAEKDSST